MHNKCDTFQPVPYRHLLATTLAGCGKKAFRSLLALSVISPKGGELNTAEPKGGAS